MGAWVLRSLNPLKLTKFPGMHGPLPHSTCFLVEMETECPKEGKEAYSVNKECEKPGFGKPSVAVILVDSDTPVAFSYILSIYSFK